MSKNIIPPESYESGKAELDKIREKIENNDFSMDELEQLIDRGKFLVEHLTNKLKIMDDKLDGDLKN